MKILIGIIAFGVGWMLGLFAGLSVTEVDPNFVNEPKRKEGEK